jgi:hypothetical protein
LVIETAGVINTGGSFFWCCGLGEQWRSRIITSFSM